VIHRRRAHRGVWLSILLAACVSTGSPVVPTPQVQTLVVVTALPGTVPPYMREEWRHWIDADGDCQDTRAEVLVRASEIPVTFHAPRTCVVETGRWHDAYTGEVVTEASELDIDHLVPLANAHRSGGWSWSSATKQAFANDLSDEWHLVPVRASVNRSKDDSGPEAWRPPSRSAWCRYATAWTRIKVRWGLTATEAEALALREMLTTCP
jgi:hypothetical protein